MLSNQEVIRKSFLKGFRGRFDLLKEVLSEKELQTKPAGILLHIAFLRIELDENAINFNQENKSYCAWLKRWQSKNDIRIQRKVEKPIEKTFTIGDYTFTDPEALDKEKPTKDWIRLVK